MNPEQLPEGARRAFENYPQIEPSAAFNRAVLQSLEAARAARGHTWIGRLEEFLGLKWWQFAASGVLGALLPAVVLGILLLSNRSATPTPMPPTAPFAPALPTTLGPLYARELWRSRQPVAPPLPDKNQGDEFSCVPSKFPLA